jgi:hypothetical protein
MCNQEPTSTRAAFDRVGFLRDREELEWHLIADHRVLKYSQGPVKSITVTRSGIVTATGMHPLGGGFNLEFEIVRPFAVLLLVSPAAGRATIPERSVIVATKPAALPRKLLRFIMISFAAR